MKTNGEVIRESNEKLAEFIKKISNNCVYGTCVECDLKSDCLNPIEYLNKKYIG